MIARLCAIAPPMISKIMKTKQMPVPMSSLRCAEVKSARPSRAAGAPVSGSLKSPIIGAEWGGRMGE